MKRTFLSFLAGLFSFAADAQPVSRAVVVEHFTNTYCSVCAARNPGFYTALRMKPEVLHIAYHPSSPYAACPLNQHNVSENDARTNYYGVYGGTPRLVINGSVIPAATNYADTAIYSPYSGGMSAFEIKTSFQRVSPTALTARVVVIRRAASSQTSLLLYGAVVEDTLQFAANNGETMHYDVFRKAAPGGEAVGVGVLNVGDSVVRTYTVTLNAAWTPSRLSYIALLNGAGGAMEQVAKTELVESSLGVESAQGKIPLQLSPNPAADALTISGLGEGSTHLIFTDATGRLVQHLTTAAQFQQVSLSGWAKGMYFVRVISAGGSQTLSFVKQ